VRVSASRSVTQPLVVCRLSANPGIAATRRTLAFGDIE
jgi:hypothetical protein